MNLKQNKTFLIVPGVVREHADRVAVRQFLPLQDVGPAHPQRGHRSPPVTRSRTLQKSALPEGT